MPLIDHFTGDQLAAIQIGLAQIFRQEPYAQPLQVAFEFTAQVWHLDLFLAWQQPGNAFGQVARSIFHVDRRVAAQPIFMQCRVLAGRERMIWCNHKSPTDPP
ncbi:hypothetical protein D3C78_1639980 [compost metagenome]